MHSIEMLYKEYSLIMQANYEFQNILLKLNTYSKYFWNTFSNLLIMAALSSVN